MSYIVRPAGLANNKESASDLRLDAQTKFLQQRSVFRRQIHYPNISKYELDKNELPLSIRLATFHMIKSKFGQRLRSRTLTTQINEALCKVLCHNLCVVIQGVHELGIETNLRQF